MALRPLAVVVLLSAVGLSACGARQVRYHLPQIAALPIGAAPVRDARGPFTTLFCEVLAHVPGQWGGCDDYLHPPDAPVQTAMPLSGDHDVRFLDGYRVLLVGGIFARCLDVTVFQDAAAHLRRTHGADVEHLAVMGNGSSEQNAGLIRDHIMGQSDPRPILLVGHSKGAVDLLEALVRHADIRPRLKALLTVASPVAGSRLVDAVPGVLKRMSAGVARVGGCELGDGRGYQSLEREARQRFFRDHLETVQALRSYSIAAVASRADTSRTLRPLWDYLARYSLDQDTHVIADEAIMPGGTFLARANGDHWAVASPVELSRVRWLRRLTDRNRYPRTALLEAALRFIVWDLNARP